MATQTGYSHLKTSRQFAEYLQEQNAKRVTKLSRTVSQTEMDVTKVVSSISKLWEQHRYKDLDSAAQIASRIFSLSFLNQEKLERLDAFVKIVEKNLERRNFESNKEEVPEELSLEEQQLAFDNIS
ncbi:MAG: hypothetical protein GWP59_05315, partial [Chlamydiales bacterium]|nr:hypothetical protein [Chlamydiales bacterium]